MDYREALTSAIVSVSNIDGKYSIGISALSPEAYKVLYEHLFGVVDVQFHGELSAKKISRGQSGT